MLHAAPTASSLRDATAAPPTFINDLSVLATVRPGRCPGDESIAAPDGWRVTTTECAWQGRLQMRQWRAAPVSGSAGAADCVSLPARWWNVLRQRWNVTARQTAWHRAWPSQLLQGSTPLQERVAIIERMAGGEWKATEWRWTPSPRAATRRWQQGRWRLLLDSAASRAQATDPTVVAPDAVLLLRAWERMLSGRAAEVAADGWRWEQAGICMRMEVAGISQAQLHLPYSREESRLEQRAAMQLRLARTYPDATWLRPFRILPPADPRPGNPAGGPPGGALYEALWLDARAVKGQLWMPEKISGAIHRARISVRLPTPGARQDDPAVPRLTEMIEQELAALANSVAADSER